MKFTKRQRRIAVVVPVVVMVAAVAVNPGGVLTRLTGHDPAAATAQTATHTGRQVTVAFSGDILVHPPTWEQAAADARSRHMPGFWFDPMFDQIRDTVSAADLAICHMEAPVVDGPPADFPAFSTPAQIVPAVQRAGYDGCTTASNHAFDLGERGIRSTIAVMDRAGMPHTGTYASEAASRVPLIYDVGGVKIASLSFATMFNENRGHSRPADKKWMANRLGDKNAVARAARAAKDAGADIVVLSAHWGTEMAPAPNVEQLQQAREFTAIPDVDLVIGHHTHSVQPVELVNGKWVVYSLGNLLARHDFPNDVNRSGIIARFTFTQGTDGRWGVSVADVVPVWLSLRPRIEVVNLPARLSKLPAVDGRRRVYEAAFERISGSVLARGGSSHGLRVVAPVG